jgi:hypothetical protein
MTARTDDKYDPGERRDDFPHGVLLVKRVRATLPPTGSFC